MLRGQRKEKRGPRTFSPKAESGRCLPEDPWGRTVAAPSALGRREGRPRASAQRWTRVRARGSKGPLSGQQALAGLFGGHPGLVNRRTPPSQLGWSPEAIFFVTRRWARGQAEPGGAPGDGLPGDRSSQSPWRTLGTRCGWARPQRGGTCPRAAVPTGMECEPQGHSLCLCSLMEEQVGEPSPVSVLTRRLQNGVSAAEPALFKLLYSLMPEAQAYFTWSPCPWDRAVVRSQ